MKRLTTLGGLAGLTAVMTLVTGCGQGLPASPTNPAVRSAPTYATLQMQEPMQQQDGMQQQSQAQQAPDVTEIFTFLKDVRLTAAQKSRIEALLKAQKPAVSQEDAQKRSEQFLTTLSAPKVSIQALTEYFNQVTASSRQSTNDNVTLLAGIRNILTPAQRVSAAAAIKKEAAEAAQQAQAQSSTDQTSQTDQQGQQQQKPPDLKLTASQQKAFAALTPEKPKTSMSDAMATFFEKGDKATLLKTMTGGVSDEAQVKKLVAAYSGLTHSQRQQIVQYSRQQQQQMQQQMQQQQQQSSGQDEGGQGMEGQGMGGQMGGQGMM